MSLSRLPAPALLTVLIAIASPAHAQNKAPYETTASLPASELVSKALIKGPLHTVADPVKIEHHFGRFVIESTSGKFSVIGENMLAVRVSELQAIEELKKVQKDSAFTDALAKSGKGLVTFAESAVTDPGKTMENIGKGVGTVFGRIGYAAKSGANYVGDKASDAVSSQPKAAPKTSATGEPEPPSFTGDPFGYNMARREWAKKLNIDPYTSNPVLRPLLDNAASATFAGNFAVTMTVGAVAAPVNYAHQLDDTVRQSVWNTPAIDLEKKNGEKLAALGVPTRAVRDLQRNKWFTPSLQTALVARLEVFGKIPGIESVVKAATVTQGEARARFLLESLAMLAMHHQKQGKFSSLKMSNLVPVGITPDGAMVVSAAVDYGTWTSETAAFAQRKELAASKKTLLVAGNVSPRAQQAFEKAGWTVKSDIRK